MMADSIKRLQKPGNPFAAIKFTRIKDMNRFIQGFLFTKKDALIIAPADNINLVKRDFINSGNI